MWKDRFVDRLQELVLAADRDRCASVTEAHIARDEASAVVSRLQAIERSHELAQQRACICAHQVSVITAKFHDAGHQAEAHISELKTIFEARITDIQDQLSHAQAQVQTMAGSLQSAAESEQERHKEVQALSDERRHLSSHLECAVAERDAMRMQLAGHTSAVSMGLEEAVAARDAEMKDYLCSHVSALLRLGCDLILKRAADTFRLRLSCMKRNAVQARWGPAKHVGKGTCSCKALRVAALGKYCCQ